MKITPPLAPYQPKRNRIGLGDVAHAIVNVTAKPAAKVIDAVAGTRLVKKLENCVPCVGSGGRKERWNAASDRAIERARNRCHELS